MTEQELKRLSRKDLIEVIYTMRKREMDLELQLKQAEQKLNEKRIVIENAGSIAEAALALNGIFEAAQAAADSYLLSLKLANADIGKKLIQAQEQSRQILEAAEKEAAARIQAAKEQVQNSKAEDEAREA